MKISSRYHRLLIYDEKRTTKINGMGPFKQLNGNHVLTLCTDYKFAFFCSRKKYRAKCAQ